MLEPRDDKMFNPPLRIHISSSNIFHSTCILHCVCTSYVRMCNNHSDLGWGSTDNCNYGVHPGWFKQQGLFQSCSKHPRASLSFANRSSCCFFFHLYAIPLRCIFSLTLLSSRRRYWTLCIILVMVR